MSKNEKAAACMLGGTRKGRPRAGTVRVDYKAPPKPGVVVPKTVTINGRERPVRAVPLATLLKDPRLCQPPEMVVPFIAAVGRVTMLAATEKLGKSTLAAFLAAVVTCGRELWQSAVKPGVVLWVGLEEEPGDAVRRFKEMGANPHRLAMLDRLTAEDPVEQLRAEVVAYQPRLIIIDSLAVFFDTDDENAAAAWKKRLMPLVELARSSRAAIIILHHANKSDGRYRGSSAIGAGMDMILEMTKSPDRFEVRLLNPRGRWSVQPFAVRYDGVSAWTLEGDIPRSAAAVQAAKTTGLQEAVFNWLSAQSAPSLVADIRRGVGGKGTDCDAALRALVEAGRVIHLGRRKGYVVALAADAHPPEKNGRVQLNIAL